ncbi:peptide-methionine (S)-S-oxide reductase MsrA [Tessaracoccus palaemonis]|uniref:Peptide methionine sulfoxide reductase MsrA n=1 Tax=Tessaracoccus palaemonis TaxID=2829499 RepID=A0ABX8SM73_9ACTN|nr:peptide-methionine (S)-S-oxide reductase MsrA [Tessaracoccus palaemonis]QXT63495.1 peptide-methionine (S)-S-oxide reductase MsrA [Tessaracoccus palaemonis]
MNDIDVLGWLQRHRSTPTLVGADEALPGRATSVLGPIPRHEVFGIPLDEVPDGSEVAYFALGCYWGAEKVFWHIDGVVNTAVGFMGGHTPNPTYKETCTGRTGHAETVRVVFDPTKVSYAELVQAFFEHHDPTQGFRQGNDVGTQYRSAIYPVDDEQLAVARTVRDAYQGPLTAGGFGEISTEIEPGQRFFYAEVEHQQYLSKNPNGYDCHIRTGVACPLP